MAQTAIITVSTIGPGTGPFNFYSLDNTGVVTGPFETGVTRAQLLAGFVSINVPNDAVTIRVVSTAIDCPVSLDIFLNIITTTTTTTLEPITTSTTTSTTTLEPTTTSTTSTSTTTSTTTAPGVPILLGYGGTTNSTSCITAGEEFLLNPITYYLPSGCFSLTLNPPCNTLYADPYLTSVPIDGTYSDGFNCYNIKGGVINDIIPLPTTTTTAPTARPSPFNMYDCYGQEYEVYSNCETVGLGCYIYADSYGTPVSPGLYRMSLDSYDTVYRVDVTGLIIDLGSCF